MTQKFVHHEEVLDCECGHEIGLWPPTGQVTYGSNESGEHAELTRLLGGPSPPAPSPEYDRQMAAIKRLAQLEGQLVECPQCHRLYWRPAGDELFRVYVPQTDRTRMAYDTDQDNPATNKQ